MWIPKKQNSSVGFVSLELLERTDFRGGGKRCLKEKKELGDEPCFLVLMFSTGLKPQLWKKVIKAKIGGLEKRPGKETES